jgi:hypothetical protein
VCRLLRVSLVASWYMGCYIYAACRALHTARLTCYIRATPLAGGTGGRGGSFKASLRPFIPLGVHCHVAATTPLLPVMPDGAPRAASATLRPLSSQATRIRPFPYQAQLECSMRLSHSRGLRVGCTVASVSGPGRLPVPRGCCTFASKLTAQRPTREDCHHGPLAPAPSRSRCDIMMPGPGRGPPARARPRPARTARPCAAASGPRLGRSLQAASSLPPPPPPSSTFSVATSPLTAFAFLSARSKNAIFCEWTRLVASESAPSSRRARRIGAIVCPTVTTVAAAAAAASAIDAFT